MFVYVCCTAGLLERRKPLPKKISIISYYNGQIAYLEQHINSVSLVPLCARVIMAT